MRLAQHGATYRCTTEIAVSQYVNAHSELAGVKSIRVLSPDCAGLWKEPAVLLPGP